MRELHAVQFDGITFGMEIDAQSAAFRNFKKNLKREIAIGPFGTERRIHTIPHLALAALMGTAHWLVSEKKLFDKIRIEEVNDGTEIYVKYTDDPIDFRTRKQPAPSV